jgi:uncharacterized membrane protein
VKKQQHISVGAHESSNQAKQERGFAFERLVFFSDAVFAIAITLLAFVIRLPSSLPTNASNTELLNALLAISSKYTSYVVSFLVIGLYWLGHHRMFRYITRYDTILLFLNLLLLLGIAFNPFPATIIGEYNNQTANVFYALTIAITGLISAVMWLYASSGGRLLSYELGRRSFRISLLRAFLPPSLYFLSAAVAFWDPQVVRVLWDIIAIFVFITLFFHRRSTAKTT